MNKEELEKLLRSKKVVYDKNELGHYITPNYTLKLDGESVVYENEDTTYTLNPDTQLSGFLNMKWGECKYAKAFGVLGFIHPGRHQDAANYLCQDNMVEYFRDYDDPLKIILELKWCLTRDQSGLIIATSKASWPRWYFLLMNDFTNGQNSDGLGEGFEQQDFISRKRGTYALHSEDSNWFKY